ncbi:MAG TPA: ATP-binding protein [Polyangiaceae bacterium]|nr:ATP-binding protein [Polyangiaceae bacterium]
MSLAQRLGLAIFALTVGVLLALGLGVRSAWRVAEERSFEAAFAQALEPLRDQLTREIAELPELVGPLCQDDPVVDSALVGLLSGDLDERRLPLSLRVPKLAKALALDELVVLTSSGEILGATSPGRVGQRDAELARQLAKAPNEARVLQAAPGQREQGGRLRVMASCIRRDTSQAKLWVGVQATRNLDTLLSRIGQSSGVELSLDAPPPSIDRLQRTLQLPLPSELSITASRSRRALLSTVEELDLTVLLIGSATLATALLITVLLSRGLARPVRSLAEQAQRVMRGDPAPVVATGARELVEAAEAFNRAIADLVALRKRLAVTERIAARREIARQVAHEIKNPLLPIRASVETLRRLRARNDPAFDEYFDEATRTVLDEVARITHIVGEFTRFARLPAPQPALFDAAEAVRSLVSLHASTGVPIDLDIEPCPELNADRDQLVQVVTNLVQNAQQALVGRSDGRVKVHVGRELDRFVLSVSDNGPGVAPELRSRLFEPYVTTKAEGTGLGLAIVQRIVIEHGGEISFHEGAGGGATFVVKLPFSGPTLLPEPPPDSGSGSQSTSDPASRP